jgi:hypothetical protein
LFSDVRSPAADEGFAAALLITAKKNGTFLPILQEAKRNDLVFRPTHANCQVETAAIAINSHIGLSSRMTA